MLDGEQLQMGEFRMSQKLHFAIAVLVIAGLASPAIAQKKSAREMMDEMKGKYGQTFDQCRALAVSRGFNFQGSDDSAGSDMMQIAIFIEGCIMGRQR
jgi:hypothetical protein